MKREKLSLDDALRRADMLPFAYIRTTEDVSLGKNTDIVIDDGLVEARWFGPAEEIRIFKRNGVFQAVVITYERGDVCILDNYSLEHTARFGCELTIRRYLAPDEDGQNEICAVCLSDWKGEDSDG